MHRASAVCRLIRTGMILEAKIGKGGPAVCWEIVLIMAVRFERRSVAVKSGEHEIAAREEVNRFLHLLAEYGLSLEGLVRNNPRSWRERERAKRIAGMLADDPELMNYVKTNHCPPPALSRIIDPADRSILERNFQYITALSWIRSRPFPVLTGYLQGADTHTMLRVKGIVLQQHGRRVTILTEDGEFRDYPSRKGIKQGQEVAVRDYSEIGTYALAFFLLFVLAVAVFYILMVSS